MSRKGLKTGYRASKVAASSRAPLSKLVARKSRGRRPKNLSRVTCRAPLEAASARDGGTGDELSSWLLTCAVKSRHASQVGALARPHSQEQRKTGALENTVDV
eukprot:Amastigsp_a508856_265.p5 type:complete len:103 gc:universal Amastigsp_a508856_265:571-263(-)